MGWLLLFGVFACRRPPERDLSGSDRSYEITVRNGQFPIYTADDTPIAQLDGFLLNDQFLGPTLIASINDRLAVTVHNESDQAVSLQPHGLDYDVEVIPALPGESVTYTWNANQGPGTFLYHSAEVTSDLVEYQAMAGILGVIVIQDIGTEQEPSPDQMINAIFMDPYSPWLTPDPDWPEEWLPSSTLIVQSVQSGITETQTDAVIETSVEQTVRVNVIAIGNLFHSFHMEGYRWQDPYTGQILDTKAIGPSESYFFDLEPLSHPGTSAIQCQVQAHSVYESAVFQVADLATP